MSHKQRVRTFTNTGRLLRVNKLKSYYVDLKDGYEIGDIYEHQGKKYEVIRIEAFNQLMEVEEIEEWTGIFMEV